jgi:cytochrome c553
MRGKAIVGGGLVALFGILVHASPLAQGEPNKGRRLAQERGCVGCHDPSGRGLPAAPYIAGQKMNYMAKQLKDFRETRPSTPGPLKIRERSHPIMDTQTHPLTDDQIRDIVEYFASLPCIPAAPQPPIQVPTTSAIVPCGFCHGDKGINPYLDYPNIAGQKKDYLVSEITAFRDSALSGDGRVESDRYHRIMAPSVWDLTDPEIAQLADFFSRQACR